MRVMIVSLALSLMLAGCAKSGSSALGGVDACALIARPQMLFGAGAEIDPGRVLDTMAGTCSWRSADGRRGGDLIVYTSQSLHGVTPTAQFEHFTDAWSKLTLTPLAPIADLGDEGQIATDLPGYQTQIVVAKGNRVIAILAWSGDPALSGEALGRRMAQAAGAAL